MAKILEKGSFSIFTTSKLDSYSAWNSLATCGKEKIWDVLEEENVSFGSLYWPNFPKKGKFRVPDEFEGEEEWPEDILDSKALVIFKNPITETLRKAFWLKLLIPRNKMEKDLVYEFYLLDRKARELFYFREKFEPQITFFVLSSPARLQQYFWMYYEPGKFEGYVSGKEVKKYGWVIERYYLEFDDFIGKLDRDNITLIILSNRGFKPKIPPKIVDKIDINKLLSEMGVLRFDYRGEIDFSATKAYTLEEGLDETLEIFVEEGDVKRKVAEVFKQARTKAGNPIFGVTLTEKGVKLKRKIPFEIKEEFCFFMNETYPFEGFLIRKVISAAPENKGFVLINKPLELPRDMRAEDFCEVLLQLI